jgi:hypothetical protein
VISSDWSRWAARLDSLIAGATDDQGASSPFGQHVHPRKFDPGAAEEIGWLRVPLTFGVVDIDPQAQRIAQALLDEPDQVVVIALYPVT